MRKIFQYKKIKYLAILLILILLLPNQAEAWNPFSIESISNAVFAKIIEWQLGLLGNILAVIMDWFDAILSMSIGFYDVPVVNAGWAISRDFANMFFIVALIIMAFATIFEISNYNFSSMVVRFILTAVLINFSLPLAKLFLHFTDILSSIFITALGTVANQLGQGLVSGIVPSGDILSTASSIFGGVSLSVMTGVWGIILIGLLIISMGTATAFIFVRIPIIWYLLIFAPIAMILNVFPTGRAGFKSWLNMIIGWGLYLPVFLFFMYFGLYFLSQMPAIISAINIGSGNSSIPGAVNFQTVFAYFLATFFILGGVKTAHSMSFLTSAHVMEWSNKPGAWVAQRYGISGAWKARKAQFQEEGLPKFKILGWQPLSGRQGQERWEAYWGGKMGVKGMVGKQQRQFLDQVKKESDDIEQLINTSGIDDQILRERAQGNATNSRVYAYRRVLAKRGQLTAGDFENTIRDLAENPLAAQDFAKASRESEFSNLQDSDVIRIASDRTLPLPARREMLSHISSKPKLVSQLNAGQINQSVATLGGSASKAGKDLLETVGKNRPDRMIEYRLGIGLPPAEEAARVAETRAIPKYAGLTDLQIRERIYREAISSDAKAVAGFSRDVWNNVEYQNALRNYIASLPVTRKSNRKQNYVNRLVEEFAGDPRFGADKQVALRTALTTMPVPDVIPPP